MDRKKFILIISAVALLSLSVFLGFVAAKVSVSLGIHSVNTEVSL